MKWHQTILLAVITILVALHLKLRPASLAVGSAQARPVDERPFSLNGRTMAPDENNQRGSERTLSPNSVSRDTAISSRPIRNNSPIETVRHSPVLQLEAVTMWRGKVMAEYAAFFRTMHFTDQQIAAFLDTRVALMQAFADVAAATSNAIEAAALQKQYQAEYQTKLQALLDIDQLASLADYEREMPLRVVVNQTVAQRCMEGRNIPSGVADAWVQVLARTNASFSSGKTAALSRQDWDAALANLPQSLNQTDLKTLREVISRVQAEARLSMQLQRLVHHP
jgi:hypothetical protein